MNTLFETLRELVPERQASTFQSSRCNVLPQGQGTDLVLPARRRLCCHLRYRRTRPHTPLVFTDNFHRSAPPMQHHMVDELAVRVGRTPRFLDDSDEILFFIRDRMYVSLMCLWLRNRGDILRTPSGHHHREFQRSRPQTYSRPSKNNLYGRNRMFFFLSAALCFSDYKLRGFCPKANPKGERRYLGPACIFYCTILF